MSNDFSRKFNDLPDETRKICGKVILSYEINSAKRELERLKNRYLQSKKEIEDRLRCMERDLNKKHQEDEEDEEEPDEPCSFCFSTDCNGICISGLDN